MEKRERISAIIPVRDGARYLPNFFLNILQTCDEQDEILFIEDHSIDESKELLNNFASNFKNVRVIQAENKGLVNALNQGIKEASNVWIARFDCDDLYAANRIKSQMNVIDEKVACIFSDYRIRGSDGQDLGLIPSPVDPLPTLMSLVTNLRTPHPIAIMRKDAVLRIGGYRESDFPAEDLSLWLRLSKVGDLVSVPEELFTYFLRKNSITATRYMESKQKAHSLYMATNLFRDTTLDAISNFEQQRKRYNRLSLSRERTFLHYVDIHMNMKYQGFKRLERIKFLLQEFHFEYFAVFYFLLRDVVKRKKYRRLNQANNFLT
jgi:glycosyltransferase involved in cell wall biosynthesis